jgi:hypothetical protein
MKKTKSLSTMERFLTNKKCHQAFENEDPVPTAEAADTLHLHDAARQQPAKRAGRGGRGEEDGHAQAAFVAAVPHGDVVGDAGEETALGEPEQAAHGEQPAKGLDDAEHDGHEAPDDHDAGDPDGGPKALHGHVGGDLGDDVKGKEDGDGDLDDGAVSKEGRRRGGPSRPGPCGGLAL